MNENQKYILRIVLLMSYIILIISLESVYRAPLFNQSLTWEAQWQNGSSTAVDGFFRAITNFGTVTVLIPLLIIVFLFFPINKSYTFLSVIIYSSYWCNLFKIIYGSPRPYWVQPSLQKTCDGGFGNPSGHSFSSSATYLAFWHLITDYEFFTGSVLGNILRFALLSFFLLLILTIMLSRIYLGVHGVNQTLFGMTLGVAIYFLFFHIFSLHKFDGTKFFGIFKQKWVNIFFAIKFAILLAVGFLVYALVFNDTSAWDQNLTSLCPSLQTYRLYNNDALFQVLIIFAIVGKHYGITLLVYLTESRYPKKWEDINNWQLGGFLKSFYRILLVIVFIIPIIPVFIISGNASMPIIIAFKVILPYLIAVFSIYGPCIFFAIKLNISNPAIHILDCEYGQNINREEISNDLSNADKIVIVK